MCAEHSYIPSVMDGNFHKNISSNEKEFGEKFEVTTKYTVSYDL